MVKPPTRYIYIYIPSEPGLRSEQRQPAAQNLGTGPGSQRDRANDRPRDGFGGRGRVGETVLRSGAWAWATSRTRLWETTCFFESKFKYMLNLAFPKAPKMGWMANMTQRCERFDLFLHFLSSNLKRATVIPFHLYCSRFRRHWS